MSFVSPAPGAKETRTDQGVDWTNVRSIVAVASGKIVQVYQNLQGFGQTIIERLPGGTEIYYAEETAGGSAVVTPGADVSQGQQLATGAGGTIEAGYWNPATGRSMGAPDFTGSNPTPAGIRFRNAIGSSGGTAAGQSSSLASLWIEAGGAPGLANTMSAIAMAESGGNVGAQGKNTNGTIDLGLWQINSGGTNPAWPQFNTNRLVTDPLYNAQAAVAVEKKQGLSAWSTYNSGAYKSFMGGSNVIKGYGGTRPGGENANAPAGAGSQVPAMLGAYQSLRDMPRKAPAAPGAFQWWLQSFTGNWADLSAGVTPGDTTPATNPGSTHPGK